MEFDKEKELNRIFNVEWRYEDYYRHIQDHIIPKESSHLVQNQKIRLLPRIRIPLKEYIPTFFAYYSEDKRITLSISGFAKNVKHSVSLVIWDKLYKEPRLYKRNVNVEVYLGRVESFETEIETVSYPTVNEDYLTLSFPITDNIIWFNDKGYMILFELYLYWPNITNPIYHWANVGNGYRPYQLIIDN